MPRWWSVALICGLVAIAYGLGAWSQARHWQPAPALARGGDAVVRWVGRRPPPDTGNDGSDREAVPCPPAGERTMVALVFGQSHGANQVRAHYVGDPGVYNYLRGRCFAAVDPLLGTGGDRGNLWTLVGNKLVRQKQFDAVVVATIAIGGTSVAQWAPGGNLYGHLLSAVNAVGLTYPITHVFIQLGETDLIVRTTSEDYARQFSELIAALRQRGVGAPIFVAVESGYCDGTEKPPPPDNPVVAAQRRVIASQEGVYLGPDMDAVLNTPADRYDGCHMSAAGAEKLARLWTQAIAKPVAGKLLRKD
jgi:lysophospholipase L1-like esterase